jgi:hypothetical protein
MELDLQSLQYLSSMCSGGTAVLIDLDPAQAANPEAPITLHLGPYARAVLYWSAKIDDISL